MGKLRQIGVEHRWIGAVRVSGVTAIGVWTYYPRSLLKDDAGPVRCLLPEILEEALDRPAILGGDFNNSGYWDKPGRADNFKDFAAELERGGLVSAYHQFTGEDFGEELQPTFFMQRKREKPCHLDY